MKYGETRVPTTVTAGEGGIVLTLLLLEPSVLPQTILTNGHIRQMLPRHTLNKPGSSSYVVGSNPMTATKYRLSFLLRGGSDFGVCGGRNYV